MQGYRTVPFRCSSRYVADEIVCASLWLFLLTTQDVPVLRLKYNSKERLERQQLMVRVYSNDSLVPGTVQFVILCR